MTQAAILAQSGSPGTTTGFKNRIINGAMNIWQRGTSVTGVGVDTYSADRWKQWGSSGTETGRSTWSQSTDVPSNQGFQYSCLVSVTTAQASFSSSQGYAFIQRIEANNMYDFAYGTSGAKTVTVSFWAKTNKTGTYTVALVNYGSSTVNTYIQAVNLTSSWAQYTLTIPGDTSVATTTTGTNAGWEFGITLTNGATSSVTNTWNALTLANRTATGQVNFYDSTSNTLNVTGIQVEVGTTATNFDFRSYGTELALCQRYYWKTYDQATVPGTVTSVGATMITVPFTGNSVRYPTKHPVAMRATPTMTYYNPETGVAGYAAYEGSGASNQLNMYTTFSGQSGVTTYNTSAGYTGSLYWQTTASAEL